MHIQYRPATPGDIDACITLRGQTRQNSISRQQLADLGITASSWGAAVASGKLVGYIGVASNGIIGYCFGYADTGEIVVLAVLPDAEGKGIGKTLLLWVVRQMISKGYLRLFLGCSDDPAVRSYGFYRRLGWCTTGTIDERGDEILEYIVANADANRNAPCPCP